MPRRASQTKASRFEAPLCLGPLTGTWVQASDFGEGAADFVVEAGEFRHVSVGADDSGAEDQFEALAWLAQPGAPLAGRAGAPLLPLLQ